ncbi:MAG: hypothetical protein CMJ44_00175 [Pimelobacter sp.]|nr:hypothetical protein [Pimelobacter sp.]
MSDRQPDALDRWTRVQTLFEAALDHDGDARTAWLRAECGDDPDLYREVAAMLGGHRTRDTLLDGFAADLFDPADLDQALGADDAGAHVGPWVLGERIGAGGMGTVYRATRDGDFEQTAALKRIKPGMDSEAVLARFRAERQILARLEHPGIARLLDGGLDADGRPYFAMELVDGEPITDLADARRLSVDNRLELFAQTCEAVAYAHRQLVVHRDLKPSNVLVSEDGRVKLLDFGIARLLSADADDGLTRTGHRVLTPATAAPEQVRGEPPTTATDVYALGGLLYRLLCGALPLDPGLSASALERAVLETVPAAPSTRVTPSAAAARGTAETALAKRLRGDLDTICGKALRKEPERRYGSAAELLADVRRHLAGLPVEARPATARYRAGLFARRHRVGLAATVASLLAVGLVTALAFARVSAERDRAQTEADKAAEVSAFLASILEGADPYQAAGDTLSAFDLLERGAARIEEDLADQPDVQAAMQHVMGGVYENLGRYEEAEALLVAALDTRRRLYGSDHLDVAETERALGIVYRRIRDGDRAEPLLRHALDVQRRRLGPDDPEAAYTQRHLASLLRNRGEYDEAERLYRASLASFRSTLGDDHPDVLDVKNSLSVLLEQTGQFDEAVGLMREVVAAQRRQAAQSETGVDASLSATLATLGTLLREQGDLDGAEAAAREALALDQSVFGDAHPQTATSMRNLASILRDREQYDEAGRLYQAALDIRRAALGPDHPRVANLLNSFGKLRAEEGDLEGAIALSREVLRIYRAQPDAEPMRVAFATGNLGEYYEQVGRADQAEALYRESLRELRAAVPAESADLAFPLESLGTLLSGQERFAEAEPLLREAVAVRRAALPAGHRYTARSERRLSDVLVGLGRPADARALLTASLRRLRSARADAELVESAEARLAGLPVAVRTERGE